MFNMKKRKIMGLFGRKKGGTRLGNLLRQIAYNNTAGILGDDLKIGNTRNNMLAYLLGKAKDIDTSHVNADM